MGNAIDAALEAKNLVLKKVAWWIVHDATSQKM
jgi:hypothetical protein